jgi:membrane fusion protein, copper/silver efflux system
MKKSGYTSLLILLVVGSFLAGYWYNQRATTKSDGQKARRILYYVDPMHPAYKSDKPGTAPDCGMQLEPVYADGEIADPSTVNGSSGSLPPGAVQISPEKQQIIGVRVGQVEKTAGVHTLRVLGRVATDETRIYRINSAVDGWIRDTHTNSTGSLVKKGEPLASFYAPEFLAAEQAYLYILGSLDRFQASGKETQEQITLTRANVQSAVDSLRTLGMGEIQIEEIKHTRQLTQNIVIYSPTIGFVLARNVSPGQRFERGTELYRIADLGHVWIFADLFEDEARYFEPGMGVQASLARQKKTFHAKVSKVLPQFDPATRTLKVRLDVENPEYVLRPDMFVDIELPISYSPTISVPVDAVLDSGLKKTVFVDRSNGFFEPREVETGWRFGDKIEIVKGLMAGERIVVSGNFLVDSESRMKAAAAGIYGTWSKDPVCGMAVDESKAKAAGHSRGYRGKTYYFCSEQCKSDFDKAPDRFAGKTSGGGQPYARPAVVQKAEVKSGVATDPTCGMEVNVDDAKAAGLASEYHGKRFYFCSPKCKQDFDKDPRRYVEKIVNEGTGQSTSAGGGHAHD